MHTIVNIFMEVSLNTSIAKIRKPMTNMHISPTNINLSREQSYLEITWQDDQVCRYTLHDLRHACPCVQCRDTPTSQTDNTLTLKPLPDYGVDDIDLVGNYAFKFDGKMGIKLGYILGVIYASCV